MFSRRLPARLDPTPFSMAVAAARAESAPLIDLTETNPTAVGLAYPAETCLALADPAGAAYQPDPLGLACARGAVAETFDVPVSPDAIVLTASTSEAYGWLFKLLCDPGDEVLVPTPSYPLFELLTGLEAVAQRPYRLSGFGGWSLDRASIQGAVTSRTRAILVVSPNNPTGSLVHDDDRAWLVAWAAERRVAIIADEVFRAYPLRPAVAARSFAGEDGALVFTLGGLSKLAGLPQMKLGWIVVSGPADRVREARGRLELIADTYLSVSTPVQLAARALLRAGASIRAQIHGRVALNLTMLRRALTAQPALTLLEPEAGWSAVVRLPAVEEEDVTVLRALREARVLVHPGYFFDFDAGRYVVVSLLAEPARFEEGVGRLAGVLSGVCGD